MTLAKILLIATWINLIAFYLKAHIVQQ